MLNALGIDPKNLEFDFKREWLFFQESRVKKFLAVWIEKEIASAYIALENVSPTELGKLQGAVSQLKKVKNLVEKKFVDEPMKDVLAFLESKER